MNKTADTSVPSSEHFPELVPVVELASLDTAVAQSALPLADGLALSDLLFGEVIDISDLIPRLLPDAGANGPEIVATEVTAAAGAGVTDGGDLLAASGHAAALTIFYDDDILASVGGIL